MQYLFVKSLSLSNSDWLTLQLTQQNFLSVPCGEVPGCRVENINYILTSEFWNFPPPPFFLIKVELGFTFLIMNYFLKNNFIAYRSNFLNGSLIVIFHLLQNINVNLISSQSPKF